MLISLHLMPDTSWQPFIGPSDGTRLNRHGWSGNWWTNCLRRSALRASRCGSRSSGPAHSHVEACTGRSGTAGIWVHGGGRDISAARRICRAWSCAVALNRVEDFLVWAPQITHIASWDLPNPFGYAGWNGYWLLEEFVEYDPLTLLAWEQRWWGDFSR